MGSARWIFGVVVAMGIGTAACGASSHGGESVRDAGSDARIASDAATTVDAGSPFDAGSPVDAASVLDAGPDAEPDPGECGLSTWADGLAPSRELRVSAWGDDGDGDGTPERPFSTLVHAVGLATPGTEIVLEGDFEGGVSIEGLAGTADEPIWISGGTFRGGDVGVHLVRARYVILSGISVDSVESAGIVVDDGGDTDDAEASTMSASRA